MKNIPPFKRNNLYGGGDATANSAIRITNLDYTADNGVVFTNIAELETMEEFVVSYWLLGTVMPEGANVVFPWVITGDTSGTEQHYHAIDDSDPEALLSQFYATVDDGGPTQIADDEDLGEIDFTEWHHFACMKDATGLYTYLDGVLLGTGFADTNIVVTSANSFFGLFYLSDSSPVSAPVDISMGQIRFYDAALTAMQIADLAAGMDVTTNLVAQINFDNNCNDVVGSMNGTKGANVVYVPGPPGLPE